MKAAIGFTIISLALVACGGEVRNTNAPTVHAADAPHVVLVSIDALKPEYFLDPARGAKIPTLRALMASGAYAAMGGVWPTVTYPSHTTMVTGVNPSRHGILANTPFDPLDTNQGGWNWYADAITAPTLWDAARAHGKTVGAIYWPVTVGATITWNFPQIWRAKNGEDDRLMRALTTPPSLATDLEKSGRSLPSETRDDAVRGDAADFVLRKYRPDLMLVYYSDLDTIQHGTGAFSPEAYATLEKIDFQVGRLLTAAREAGTLATTTFLVVSDHGFANVDHVVRPAVVLAKSGLIDVDPNGHVRDWKAAVLGAGGTCGIFMKDPNDAAARGQTRGALEAMASDPANGIGRIDDDVFAAKVEGFGGAAFVLEAAPGFYFSSAMTGDVVSATGDKGMHGYPPEHGDMRASFIASGPAVTARGSLGQVRMIDLAPTIARILGFEMPSAEGRVIAGVGR